MARGDRVLYVDDEPENLRTFKFLFKKEFNVFIATSADKAIELLKIHSISVVISDQRMPGISGVELLEYVNTNYPETIKILITGYSDIEAVINSINKAQIYRYVSKPFLVEEMRLILNNAVNLYNLKKQNIDLINQLIKTNKVLREQNINFNAKIVERTTELKNFYDNKLSYFVKIAQEFSDSLSEFNLSIDKSNKSDNSIINTIEFEKKMISFNLSKRERQITELLLKGLSYNQISNTLNISESTVITHKQNIYKKLSVNNRDSLIALLL